MKSSKSHPKTQDLSSDEINLSFRHIFAMSNFERKLQFIIRRNQKIINNDQLDLTT